MRTGCGIGFLMETRLTFSKEGQGPPLPHSRLSRASACDPQRLHESTKLLVPQHLIEVVKSTRQRRKDVLLPSSCEAIRIDLWLEQSQDVGSLWLGKEYYVTACGNLLHCRRVSNDRSVSSEFVGCHICSLQHLWPIRKREVHYRVETLPHPDQSDYQ
jgi:hypothetical protein